jgi:hypothetical protein
MEQIAVDTGGLSVHVRGLSGQDELALAGGPGAMRRLVGRLLEADGSNAAVDALTIAQRDRLLAALWRHTFGDVILATHRCAACGERFDLRFALSELVESLWARPCPDEVAELTADRRARLRSGGTVRAATGADEAAVAGLPAAEAAAALQARCVEGEAPDEERLDDVLDWLNPVVDTELDAVCPECGRRQDIRFALEPYFLAALQGQKPQLMRDVHQLASTYGWGLDEILGLSRHERRTLVAYAEAERAGARLRSWS